MHTSTPDPEGGYSLKTFSAKGSFADTPLHPAARTPQPAVLQQPQKFPIFNFSPQEKVRPPPPTHTHTARRSDVAVVFLPSPLLISGPSDPGCAAAQETPHRSAGRTAGDTAAPGERLGTEMGTGGVEGGGAGGSPYASQPPAGGAGASRPGGHLRFRWHRDQTLPAAPPHLPGAVPAVPPRPPPDSPALRAAGEGRARPAALRAHPDRPRSAAFPADGAQQNRRRRFAGPGFEFVQPALIGLRGGGGEGGGRGAGRLRGGAREWGGRGWGKRGERGWMALGCSVGGR